MLQNARASGNRNPFKNLRPQQFKIHAARLWNPGPSPLRHRLRRDLAQTPGSSRAAKPVDHHRVGVEAVRAALLLHAVIVSTLTQEQQVYLQDTLHHGEMAREPSSPAERIRWAIEQSEHRLENIATGIGCTHSALSQWQTGKTNIANVKVGLLLEFCKFTGANISWLLTGDGPRLSTYGRPGSEAPLVAMARHIVQDLSPDTADTAYRVLAALDSAADLRQARDKRP